MFSLSANHFQPESQESLTNQKSPIRSLVVIVPKLKSQLSSFENLRGIVRLQKLSEVKSLSKPKSRKVHKERTVRQRFFNRKSVFFLFFTMLPNDRGYGLGRPAGEFPVVKRQRKCGRKDCLKHISRPRHIGVC